MNTKKTTYVKPETEVVHVCPESYCAGLDLPVSPGFVNDEAAKEHGGIWGEINDEEDITNPSKNLWGDDDDNNYGY